MAVISHETKEATRRVPLLSDGSVTFRWKWGAEVLDIRHEEGQADGASLLQARLNRAGLLSILSWSGDSAWHNLVRSAYFVRHNERVSLQFGRGICWMSWDQFKRTQDWLRENLDGPKDSALKLDDGSLFFWDNGNKQLALHNESGLALQLDATQTEKLLTCMQGQEEIVDEDFVGEECPFQLLYCNPSINGGHLRIYGEGRRGRNTARIVVKTKEEHDKLVKWLEVQVAKKAKESPPDSADAPSEPSQFDLEPWEWKETDGKARLTVRQIRVGGLRQLVFQPAGFLSLRFPWKSTAPELLHALRGGAPSKFSSGGHTPGLLKASSTSLVIETVASRLEVPGIERLGLAGWLEARLPAPPAAPETTTMTKVDPLTVTLKDGSSFAWNEQQTQLWIEHSDKKFTIAFSVDDTAKLGHFLATELKRSDQLRHVAQLRYDTRATVSSRTHKSGSPGFPGFCRIYPNDNRSHLVSDDRVSMERDEVKKLVPWLQSCIARDRWEWRDDNGELQLSVRKLSPLGDGHAGHLLVESPKFSAAVMNLSWQPTVSDLLAAIRHGRNADFRTSNGNIQVAKNGHSRVAFTCLGFTILPPDEQVTKLVGWLEAQCPNPETEHMEQFTLLDGTVLRRDEASVWLRQRNAIATSYSLEDLAAACDPDNWIHYSDQGGANSHKLVAAPTASLHPATAATADVYLPRHNDPAFTVTRDEAPLLLAFLRGHGILADSAPELVFNHRLHWTRNNMLYLQDDEGDLAWSADDAEALLKYLLDCRTSGWSDAAWKSGHVLGDARVYACAHSGDASPGRDSLLRLYRGKDAPETLRLTDKETARFIDWLAARLATPAAKDRAQEVTPSLFRASGAEFSPGYHMDDGKLVLNGFVLWHDNKRYELSLAAVQAMLGDNNKRGTHHSFTKLWMSLDGELFAMPPTHYARFYGESGAPLFTLSREDHHEWLKWLQAHIDADVAEKAAAAGALSVAEAAAGITENEKMPITFGDKSTISYLDTDGLYQWRFADGTAVIFSRENAASLAKHIDHRLANTGTGAASWCGYRVYGRPPFDGPKLIPVPKDSWLRLWGGPPEAGGTKYTLVAHLTKDEALKFRDYLLSTKAGEKEMANSNTFVAADGTTLTFNGDDLLRWNAYRPGVHHCYDLDAHILLGLLRGSEDHHVHRADYPNNRFTFAVGEGVSGLMIWDKEGAHMTHMAPSEVRALTQWLSHSLGHAETTDSTPNQEEQTMTPDEYDKKQSREELKQKFIGDPMKEMVEGAYDVAAHQFIQSVKAPLIARLTSGMGGTIEEQESFKVRLGSSLNTPAGEALIRMLTAAALGFVPVGAQEIRGNLAYSLRRGAYSQVGNAVADILMDPLRETMAQLAVSVPDMPAVPQAKPAALPREGNNGVSVPAAQTSPAAVVSKGDATSS